jgi:putative salt-induced outer membrane protein
LAIPRVFIIALPSLVALAASSSAWADEPAPPPPMGVWIGKGQLGFLNSKGNSDAQSVNANLDLSRYDGLWKNALYLAGLYGKSAGIVSAERWEVREQTNYAFSGDLFAFGALRYEHDLFNGFQYQASVAAGIGYKIIATDATSLTAQVGAGYRRLRPETITKDASGEVISRVPLDTMGEAIGTAGVDFSHKFNSSTILTNKFLAEIGSSNTMLQDQLNLAVKMNTHLALTVGYGVIDNTNPPAPLKKIDTVTTVNLQFSF